MTLLGAIIGRYRTLNPFWFNIHAGIQLLAGFLIIPGFALGVNYKNRLADLGATTSSQHNVNPFFLLLVLTNPISFLVVSLLVPFTCRTLGRLDRMLE